MDRQARIAFRFERPVAARAMPPPKDIGLRFEDMALVTVHWHAIEIDMHERDLFLMALRTDTYIRSVEGGFVGVVAFVALHLLVGHVSRMPRRTTHLLPTFGHCPWRRFASRCLDLLNVACESNGQEPSDESNYREHDDCDQGAFHKLPK